MFLVAGLLSVVGASSASAADECGFPDVDTSNIHCKNIAWAGEKGISKPIDHKYHPTDTVTRGQMTAFLFRVTHPGEPSPKCSNDAFPDVDSSNIFCGYITWAQKNEVAKGYRDKEFKSDRGVTRGAMAAFLKRIATDDPTPKCTEKPYEDIEIDNEFCGVITWMEANKLTSGVGNGTNYDATGMVSRQQMASFLHRVADYIAAHNNDEGPSSDTPTPTIGAVHGIVSDADSNDGIKDIRVLLFGLENGSISTDLTQSTTTAADGSYEFDSVPFGSAYVCFNGSSTNVDGFSYASTCYKPGAMKPNSSTPVDDTGTITVDADHPSAEVSVALDLLSSISGTVTANADGTPLENVYVIATMDWGIGTPVTYATRTADDGSYTLNNVAAIDTYTVCFYPDGDVSPATDTGYLSQCYDDVDGTLSDPAVEAAAKTIDAQGGQATTGIDAALNPSAGITGTVTDKSTSDPIADAVVVLVYDNEGGSTTTKTAWTDETGAYHFRRLDEAVTYAVCVKPIEGDTDYEGACDGGTSAWPGYDYDNDKARLPMGTTEHPVTNGTAGTVDFALTSK